MFVKPRLTDLLDLSVPQSEVDFLIPHLTEDLPFCVDPFLLWASTEPEYQALHAEILAFFDLVRARAMVGEGDGAQALLRGCVEARELGLGYALGSKRGSAIGQHLAGLIVDAFRLIPQLRDGGMRHAEELQLVIPGLAEDRLSDIVASVIRRWFIDYTRDRAKAYGIPTRTVMVDHVFDAERGIWRPYGQAALPWNPRDNTPLLFAPLNLLRHLPWINYEDYYQSAFAPLVLGPQRRDLRMPKAAVLAHNREHYTMIAGYVTDKEMSAAACQADPLFVPLGVEVLRRKVQALRKLAPGPGTARRYEQLAGDVLASLLYPELLFAKHQVRTDSGAHIRDVIFYNDGVDEFCRDLRTRYAARQPVMELKNVEALEPDHVDQLYRYLDEEIGRFGVLVTRNPAPRAVARNLVDLHSSKRALIIWLTDEDLSLMIEVAAAGDRPIKVLKRAYAEFTRLLPK
jgi:hypothetical protein